MAWAEAYSGGGFRGRYRDADGEKQYVLDPDGMPFRREKDAKDAAIDEERKASRRAGKGPAATRSAKTTWGDWWDLLVEKRYRAKVTDTRTREQRAVERHIRPKWGTVPLNKIKRQAIQDWIDDDLCPGRSASTVRTIYSPFRTSITAAVKKEVLDASPCVGIDLPSVKKRARRQMSAKDEAALLGRLNPRYQHAVRFQRRTGLRPGELVGLHANQLDLEAGWVSVSNVYVESHNAIRSYPKDDDYRLVPLTTDAIAAASAALEGRDLTAGCGVQHADGRKCRSVIVFLSPRGRLIKPSTYKTALRRACEAAKISLLSPYTARRGFATMAKDQDVDPFTIKDLMGHSKLDQTADYVQFTETARRKFLAAMGDPVQLSVVGQDDHRGAEVGAEVDGQPLAPDGAREAGSAS